MVQQKFKTMICCILLIKSCLLFINAETFQAQSSENYNLIKSSINQGGYQSKSENFEVIDAIGQSSAIGTASGENYAVYAGFFYGNEYLISAVDEDDALFLPDKFQLLQNYPNPFNPVTRIEYHLPQAADVKLIIYNVNGHTVRELVNGTISAGYHKVIWDGKNAEGMAVASGIYFYRIEIKANDLKQSFYVNMKKMILMK